MSDRVRSRLNGLDEYLTEHVGINFGNRVFRQAETFIPVYIACGGSWEEAADMLICRKILSKMDGLDPVFCRGEADGVMQRLQELFGKEKTPLCASYLKKYKAVV